MLRTLSTPRAEGHDKTAIGQAIIVETPCGVPQLLLQSLGFPDTFSEKASTANFRLQASNTLYSPRQQCRWSLGSGQTDRVVGGFMFGGWGQVHARCPPKRGGRS